MEPELTVNGTYVVNDIHPCYESDNTTYIFTSNPSIICLSAYVFLGLLSVTTICGNLLVITSIIYFKQLHTPTNYLILSLAVADLLVGVLVFPFSMAFSLSSCLYHENLFCKIRDSFDISLCTSSILNLCCISIDRYQAVHQPLTYRTKMTVHVTLIMILVCWGISALIGIGIIIAGFSQGTCEEMCSVDVALANILGPVLSFYFPAIIMICIYLKIFLVARKQVNSIQKTTCQSIKSGATVSKMERKATKTLAIVMGVFLLCMSPYFLCVVFQPLAYNPPPVPVIEALNWLTLSNSMLNPFIYAFFYKWFRSAFRMIITGKIFQGDFANSELFL
ncbi:trace amine-associated receptor 1-like [Thunnus maccoyii]|nr:trace amine-associated receptor 1-like [Thunnus maccoyii]